MSIVALELKRFAANANCRVGLSNGVTSLRSSGVFELLRMFARPFARDGGKDLASQAHQASYCEGYNAALDDLMYFEVKYFNNSLEEGKKVKADFGGLKFALANGDLTKVEVEKLRK